MVTSDISNIVSFKKDDGNTYDFNDKYIGLKALDDNMFVFSVEAPQEIVGESMLFFESLKIFEPMSVDIGGTGDIAVEGGTWTGSNNFNVDIMYVLVVDFIISLDELFII